MKTNELTKKQALLLTRIEASDKHGTPIAFATLTANDNDRVLLLELGETGLIKVEKISGKNYASITRAGVEAAAAINNAARIGVPDAVASVSVPAAASTPAPAVKPAKPEKAAPEAKPDAKPARKTKAELKPATKKAAPAKPAKKEKPAVQRKPKAERIEGHSLNWAYRRLRRQATLFFADSAEDRKHVRLQFETQVSESYADLRKFCEHGPDAQVRKLVKSKGGFDAMLEWFFGHEIHPGSGNFGVKPGETAQPVQA